MKGASIPLAGFGSSDCECETHLFFFKRRPGIGSPTKLSQQGMRITAM
jgi:Uri superfamily endonuclease